MLPMCAGGPGGSAHEPDAEGGWRQRAQPPVESFQAIIKLSKYKNHYGETNAGRGKVEDYDCIQLHKNNYGALNYIKKTAEGGFFLSGFYLPVYWRPCQGVEGWPHPGTRERGRVRDGTDLY